MIGETRGLGSRVRGTQATLMSHGLKMRKLALAALALAVIPVSCQAPLRTARAADAKNMLVVLLLNKANGKVEVHHNGAEKQRLDPQDVVANGDIEG
jgi:hypothetical protein